MTDNGGKQTGNNRKYYINPNQPCILCGTNTTGDLCGFCLRGDIPWSDIL